MKIILAQAEIEEAIHEFIKKSMTLPEDKEFVIDVSSSRGIGVTAEISIQATNDVVETVEPEPVVEEVQEEVKTEEVKPKKSFFSNLE